MREALEKKNNKTNRKQITKRNSSITNEGTSAVKKRLVGNSSTKVGMDHQS